MRLTCRSICSFADLEKLYRPQTSSALGTKRLNQILNDERQKAILFRALEISDYDMIAGVLFCTSH